VPLPEVRLGEPDKKDGYKKYITDNICVYVVKSLEPKGETISIKLNSFLGIKSFDVTGFKVL